MPIEIRRAAPRASRCFALPRLALAAALAAWAFPAAQAARAAAVTRVFVVVLENEDGTEAYRQPFLHRLADEGALLEGSVAVAHPSYPNYLALTSGSTWGVKSDRQRTLDATHIGDLLEAKGKTWKLYAEGYPGDCFLGRRRRTYTRSHVPFLSYRNVQEAPARCARVVEAGELRADLERGTLPDFMMYIPHNDHNGHNTGVARADRYLEQTLGPLLGDRRFTDGLLLVVTFDEDDKKHDNHIYTALWGAKIVAGARPATPCTHYSLLRTIEDQLGLGRLGREDDKAAPITGVWR
jgi:hypothetical protein